MKLMKQQAVKVDGTLVIHYYVCITNPIVKDKRGKCKRHIVAAYTNQQEAEAHNAKVEDLINTGRQYLAAHEYAFWQKYLTKHKLI